MARAVHVLLLLCCLLLVCRSQRWSVDMPGEVVGLSSSCVLLPCSFSLPPDFEPHLDQSCRAVWKRGSWSRTLVYDSGASDNVVQGNLSGSLQNKDCSTVFYSLPPNHYDHYYFRLECEQLKYNFPESVLVEEGSLVTLNCSAVSPCPSEAPVVQWSPALGEVLEVMDGRYVWSILNFSATHLHDGVTVSCSALYSRPADNTELLYESSLTLHVLYPPKNTSVLSPGSVREGSPVTLSCMTKANPAVDWFSWYSVDGDQITAVGSTQNYSTIASEAQSHFFCQVANNMDARTPPSLTWMFSWWRAARCPCSVRPAPTLRVPLLLVQRRTGADRGEGAVLVWETADHSHSGSYHCEARNQLGQDQSGALQLDVQYPPRTTVVSSSPSGPVEDGGLVTLSVSRMLTPLV
ncbi:hypothetical protein WMY93_026620 [Mugilogobius chulae]|uniref:Ig-like domain-containing protein n=1 Tax=Mugilogobius chulae TaxID=88201 RepID=A0AAW0N1H4_9GOBI